jgi:NAD(P)-dependent dehydrogenase (short-subunit alcohol dehydrogenase family)
LRLSGRVAIVTGAGRGIGRGYARLLAAEGATVVVNDFGAAWDGTGQDDRPAQQVVDEIVAAGGSASTNYSDVSDWTHGHALIDNTVERYGRLDILICNAGILRDRMLFNLGEDDWDNVVRVHLKGHFVPTRAAARHWRSVAKETGEPTYASVIFTSSSSGLYGNAGQSNYDAAKAGIASMAIAAARELAAYGVRVNAISPSARTRLTEQTFETDQRSGTTSDFDAMDPENVAPWVTYLCTDAAKDISGQIFEVRGGLVQRVEGWHRVAEISQQQRWSIDELEIRAKELLGDGPTGPPQMPTF